MPLFRALAKNMAPMTNADESPYAFLTEHFSLYSIYSLVEVLAVQSLTLQSSTKHTGLEPVDLFSTNDKALAEIGLKIK